MNQSELIFLNKLSSAQLRSISENSLLIYDKRLRLLNWVQKWPVKFSVVAGEKLKDLNEFPKHIDQIIKCTEKLPSRKMSVVALGGGSVGDFAGFVASVFKRGVPFFQIPSTWLAAIDSAHGGKTALNVPPYKNQIGTFHPADKVFFLKDLLKGQPEELANQALSELLKISLIDSRSFWDSLAKDIVQKTAKRAAKSVTKSDLLWEHLERAVAAKWRVIKKDPFEKKGHRQILNLGHTFGHFIESELGLSHGESVAQGLIFCCEWSLSKKFLSQKDYDGVLQVLEIAEIKKNEPIACSRSRCRKILLQDKKKVASDKVNFIFLKRPGNAAVLPVTATEIVDFAHQRGWIR